MLKISFMVAAGALAALSVPAVAAPSAAPAAQSSAPAAPAAPAAATKYNTADTELGTLLDNPAAKAVVEKHIPGFTTNEQIDMARGMTLKGIQQYAPEEVTDARLAAIEAELAALK